MLARVTAKDVGDVLLGHSIHVVVSEVSVVYRLPTDNCDGAGFCVLPNYNRHRRNTTAEKLEENTHGVDVDSLSFPLIYFSSFADVVICSHRCCIH